MKIWIDDAKILLNVKLCKYSAEQRKYFKDYLDN